VTPASDETVVERFAATSGRLTGVLVLVFAGVVALVAVADPGAGVPSFVVAAAALVGVLTWAVMLRPALWATADHLVLRNAFETVRVPLAAVERAVVGRVTAVQAGEKRYVSTVVHRTLRALMRGPGQPTRAGEAHYADFVEERISQLAAEARERHGVRLYGDDQLALARGVRRQPAWPEIALAAVAVVALVVTLIV
jgi:hypothetical protein